MIMLKNSPFKGRWMDGLIDGDKQRNFPKIIEKVDVPT